MNEPGGHLRRPGRGRLDAAGSHVAAAVAPACDWPAARPRPPGAARRCRWPAERARRGDGAAATGAAAGRRPRSARRARAGGPRARPGSDRPGRAARPGRARPSAGSKRFTPRPPAHRYSPRRRLRPQAQAAAMSSASRERRRAPGRCRRSRRSARSSRRRPGRSLIAVARSADSRVNARARVARPGAEHRRDGRGVVAVVVKRPDLRRARRTRRRASLTAAATAGAAGVPWAALAAAVSSVPGPGPSARTCARVVRLVGVVAGVVDQGKALVGVRLLGRDADLGDRLDRGRAAGLRVEQVAPGARVGEGQPGQRDDEDDARGEQAGVEHPVGAPAQPARRPVQQVADERGRPPAVTPNSGSPVAWALVPDRLAFSAAYRSLASRSSVPRMSAEASRR